MTSFSWFVPYHALRHPNDHRALAMICTTYLLDPGQAVQESTKTVWQRDLKEAHPWSLWGRTYVGLNIILLVPFIVMFVVLYQQAYISITERDITLMNGNAPAIKVCSAILALANAAVYSNWNLNVAILQPYHLVAECLPGKSLRFK
jgi:hypothetical protein